jgi:hypothetical protein
VPPLTTRRVRCSSLCACRSNQPCQYTPTLKSILGSGKSNIREFHAMTSRERRLPTKERVAGWLEVGLANDSRRIVISCPDLKPDEKGCGEIVLSPRHARHLANVLIDSAADAEAKEAERRPLSGHSSAMDRVARGAE